MSEKKFPPRVFLQTNEAEYYSCDGSCDWGNRIVYVPEDHAQAREAALLKEIEKLKDAIERYALPCALWFLKGPYGSSPEQDSVEKLHELIKDRCPECKK